MARTLFGGGVLTGTLLLVSLTLNPIPSVAENLAPDDSIRQTQEQRHDTQAPGLFGETTASVLESSAAAKSEAPGTTKLGAAALSSAVKTVVDRAGAIAPQTFTATAYALRGRTASGATVRRGVIAADHRVLPLGTRVRLEAGSYSGEYLVADTGGAVRGRKIDIWVPSGGEAMRFGRRPIKLSVLGYPARAAGQTKKKPAR